MYYQIEKWKTEKSGGEKIAKQELDRLKEELKDKTEEREEYSKTRSVYNVASELLKDSGIKARVIKNYLPIINKLVNKYLTSLDFYVDFQLDENFRETVKSRFRDEFSYESFSEGEKMRIDLALLFTWRTVAKLKNSTNTNLLILDEVFDSSLDSTGTEEFLKIIKGTKIYSKRTYDYDIRNLEFTYENFDKEIDDLQREMEYIKKNPNYILETYCEHCLEWDLNDEMKHDVKNINFILEDYLTATQVRVDELQNDRQKLIDNFKGVSGSEGADFRNIYLVVIKVSDGNIIAKIINKDTPYIIPKVGDRVLLNID